MMTLSPELLKIIYLVGLIIAEAFRFPQRLRHTRESQQGTMVDDRSGGLERVLLALVILGNWVIPILYAVTPWLNFADYSLPGWAAWLGVGAYAICLWIRWRAQSDLGRNFSSTLTVWQEHHLVTEGIYGYIRHPIYAALWLGNIAQPLLLQNWIAGLSGLAAVVPLYFLRVPREEAMLVEHFGEEYRTYMRQVGRIFPRIHRSHSPEKD